MRLVEDIFGIVAELQNLPRKGWVDYRIKNPETVWEHLRDVRRMSRDLGERFFGAAKAELCARYGGLHDVTEAIVSDITPHMGVTPRQKYALEKMAIDHIGSMSPGGKRIRDYWLEYVAQDNDAAQLVHQVDKLQLAVKCLEYERRNATPYNLQPLWDSTRASLRETPLIGALDVLEKKRPEHAKSKPPLKRRPTTPEMFPTLYYRAMQKMGYYSTNRP